MENWEQINAVQRMQDYIERHLMEPVALEDLAKAAGYSPWYSAKIFKELTGKAPFEYLRMYRLSRAALALRDGERRVLDLALDCTFDSHEGFTRAFRKQFGLGPNEYRKSPPPLYLFHPWSVRDYFDYCLNEEKHYGKNKEEIKMTEKVFIEPRELPVRRLIYKPAKKADEYFSYVEEVGCDVWGLLCSIKEALYEPVGMWLPENLRPEGVSRYVQGVEVPADYSREPPEGFAVLDLPACKVLLFQGEPFDDARYGEAITNLYDAMDKFNPEQRGYVWADDAAPRFQFEPQGCRGYMEGRPVRAK